MPRQVRLDDDVAEALAQAVARTGGGQSLSHAANVRLRQMLRLPLTSPADLEEAHRGTQGLSRARATAARTGVRAGRVKPAACRHPVSRRIGDRCADCGGPVKR